MNGFNVMHTKSRENFAAFKKVIFVAMAALASTHAVAASVNITARFSPNPNKPYENRFINTTPVGGYCANFVKDCENKKMFSISLPLKFNEKSTIKAGHTDPRQGGFIKVPSGWRDITVTSSQGDTQNLKLRVSGIGARYRLSKGIDHSTAWSGGTWGYAPKPCQPSLYVSGNSTVYSFFWGTPSDSPCIKQALVDIYGMWFDTLNIGYELFTPNPLEMEAGFYTGTTNFTVGANQDIDFGDAVVPSDSVLTVNFKLEVQHMLKVQFPPGADRLSLNPDGGWQQWLHRGRRPEKLTANQAFQVWSSSKFKMQLQCQYSVGNRCGIQNDAGHLVPVETSVTLPAGLVDKTNKPVNHYPLSKSDRAIFYPTFYVDNARAALHFEVNRDSVKQMTEFAGSRYSGNVTVVWDTQI